MRRCPYCNAEVPDDDLRAEIEHMEDVHPGLIEQRMREMGRPDIAEERAQRREQR